MNGVDEEDRDSDLHTVQSSGDIGCTMPGPGQSACNPDEFVAQEPYVKLFVGSLPYDINEEDVMDVFTKFGDVLEFKILRDRSGRSKGCSALRYASREAADLCIATLHNKFCCGNVPTPLQVRYFERRDSGFTTCLIEGLPFCFSPPVVWASLSRTYGPVSNVYPDAVNPFAVYISFTRKSSTFALCEDARNGALCVGGLLCPNAKASVIENPMMYPYGYYPSYPTGMAPVSHQAPVVTPAGGGFDALEDPPVKLFVGCLPYSKTAQDIADLFTPFGDLLEVAILTDYSGKSRGAAFVTFSKTSEANKAVDALKDFSFPKSTRSINISFAYKQNIWHNRLRSNESGAAPSCTSSVSCDTTSPTSTDKGLTEAFQT